MSIERLEKIIEKYKALNTLANNHKEVLYDAFLNKNVDLKQESYLREEYNRQIDANRDLQIGIVGRVKAGKSSLLNALLFEGSAILPKAATPMTAALTILSYSEKLKVTIRFFEQRDFKRLKETSEIYEDKFRTLVEEFVEKARNDNKIFAGVEKKAFDESKAKERASREAKRILRENIGLTGGYEQYKQIEESPVAQQEVAGQVKVLYPKSVAEISSMLEDYVGSKGKYMPFTQSVEIAYPNEKLKGIRIVDTPGFNDPVPSREDRANQLLKTSDVILILSLAGRFLDANDKIILDKVTTKDGLRELFVVASQVDAQLLGDEYIDKPLDEVQNDISERLSRQARAILKDCNASGAFDQLVNDDGSRVILTSGDCHSMYLTFANKNSWDDNKKKIWENLCEDFKDYFSDKDDATSKESLKRLGNIDVIDSKIGIVKQKKNEILADSANKICTSWENAVEDLKKGMVVAVKQQINKIKVGNIDEFRNKKESTESICFKLDSGISNAVNKAVDGWRSGTTEKMMHFVDSLRAASKKEADGAKSGFFRREYSHTTGMWWWKENHYENVSHTRVSPRQLRSSIEDYVGKINNHLRALLFDVLSQLRMKISSEVAGVWARKVPEENMDEDVVACKINAIIAELNIPELKLPENSFPRELLENEAQEDEKGDHLLSVCRSHLNDLANKTSCMLVEEIARYASSIKKADLSTKLLERYRNDLDTLIKDIEDKEKSIGLYEQILIELEKVA